MIDPFDRPPVRVSPRPRILFAATPVVLLILLLPWAMPSVLAWLQSSVWRRAPARVIDARVVEVSHLGQPLYKGVAVEYEFDTPYGLVFRGNQYQHWPWWERDSDRPREIVARLRAGGPITVWYDPANPRRSVVTRGLTRDAPLQLGRLAIVLAILGGATMFGAKLARWARLWRWRLPAAPPPVRLAAGSYELRRPRVGWIDQAAPLEGWALLPSIATILGFWHAMVIRGAFAAGAAAVPVLVVGMVPAICVGAIVYRRRFSTAAKVRATLDLPRGLDVDDRPATLTVALPAGATANIVSLTLRQVRVGTFGQATDELARHYRQLAVNAEHHWPLTLRLPAIAPASAWAVELSVTLAGGAVAQRSLLARFDPPTA